MAYKKSIFKETPSLKNAKQPFSNRANTKACPTEHSASNSSSNKAQWGETHLWAGKENTPFPRDTHKKTFPGAPNFVVSVPFCSFWEMQLEACSKGSIRAFLSSRLYWVTKYIALEALWPVAENSCVQYFSIILDYLCPSQHCIFSIYSCELHLLWKDKKMLYRHC